MTVSCGGDYPNGWCGFSAAATVLVVLSDSGTYPSRRRSHWPAPPCPAMQPSCHNTGGRFRLPRVPESVELPLKDTAPSFFSPRGPLAARASMLRLAQSAPRAWEPVAWACSLVVSSAPVFAVKGLPPRPPRQPDRAPRKRCTVTPAPLLKPLRKRVAGCVDSCSISCWDWDLSVAIILR